MSDGKYYDDRAIAFRSVDSHQNDKIYMYGAGNSSKKEITLPYYPNEEIIILPNDYADTDNINHNINYNDPEPDYEVE